MPGIQVSYGDMAVAENSATSAADGARGKDGARHLTAAGAALPGATSAGYLGEAGTHWQEFVDGWADNVAAFGAQVQAQSDDFASSDATSGVASRAVESHVHSARGAR